MGLLDDAIRDHLDLKRRRGADPAEVERAEREALGPVRRGPEEPAAIAEQEPPVEYAAGEGDGAGWDQLAHDAAQGHEDDQFDDDEYEEEYPDPPPAAGRVQLDEPPYDELPPRAPDAADATDATHATHAGAEQPPPVAAQSLPPNGAEPPSDARPDDHRVPGALEFTGSHEALGETVEYDVERAIRDEHGEHPPADDDMLEETPEFLQDTPDHDRLWFEQRPPKDFDFDG